VPVLGCSNVKRNLVPSGDQRGSEGIPETETSFRRSSPLGLDKYKSEPLIETSSCISGDQAGSLIRAPPKLRGEPPITGSAQSCDSFEGGDTVIVTTPFQALRPLGISPTDTELLIASSDITPPLREVEPWAITDQRFGLLPPIVPKLSRHD
jgi:hypothetical protein